MPAAPRRFQSTQTARKGWQHQGSSTDRGYGADWQRLRDAYIAEHRMCELCETKGKLTDAVEIHHKEPFKGKDDPLRLDWDNLEALCRPCHRFREHQRRGGAKA